MSQMKMMHTMEHLMEQMIEEAIRATFREGRSSGDAADDVDAFIHSLFIRLGLRTPGEVLMMKSVAKMRLVLAASHDDNDEVMPPLEKADDDAPAAAAAAAVSAPASVVETASDGESAGKDRKRTVSKKMKDTFLAMEGGDEDSLKAAMKVYKAADQAQIDAWGGKWDAFARAFLAGECTPVKKTKAKAAPKAKADPDAPAKAPKAPKEAKNFTWTPTAKKLFAEVVEGNGGTVTDALKSEFVAHVNAMDVEKFKMVAPVGHIRAFIASKAPGASRPVHDTEGRVLGFTTTPPPESAAEDDDDDEDLEEIEVEGETLTIGVKSGKIYRATEDSGDVQIGVAGVGKFAAVKIPSA